MESIGILNIQASALPIALDLVAKEHSEHVVNLISR